MKNLLLPLLFITLSLLSCRSIHKGNQMYDSSQKYLDSSIFLLHVAIRIYQKDATKANILRNKTDSLQKIGEMYADSMTYYFNK